MIEFNQKPQHLTPKLNSLFNKLNIIQQNSNVISIIIYPAIECYNNISNIFTKEYPVRSSIRCIIILSAFAAGPLLTELAQFTWLQNRANALYETIPVFNLLPANVGTAMCSSYLCAYFFTWGITQATNFYNKMQFDGKEHYLTPGKIKEIYQKITSNNFNITPQEIKSIFDKINDLWRTNPKNEFLLKMLLAIRRGDFQLIIDESHLLETQISIIEDKIKILLDANHNNYTVLNNSMASIPENINLTELQNSSVATVEQADLILSPHVIENNQLFTRNLEINNPPIKAILYQYSNKHTKHNHYREDQAKQIAINNLTAHKQQLVNSRFLELGKNYVIN